MVWLSYCGLHSNITFERSRHRPAPTKADKSQELHRYADGFRKSSQNSGIVFRQTCLVLSQEKKNDSDGNKTPKHCNGDDLNPAYSRRPFWGVLDVEINPTQPERPCNSKENTQRNTNGIGSLPPNLFIRQHTNPLSFPFRLSSLAVSPSLRHLRRLHLERVRYDFLAHWLAADPASLKVSGGSKKH